MNLRQKKKQYRKRYGVNPEKWMKLSKTGIWKGAQIRIDWARGKDFTGCYKKEPLRQQDNITVVTEILRRRRCKTTRLWKKSNRWT